MLASLSVNDSRLQIGEVVTTIPTIGFNVESVTYRNLNLNVWVGGLPFMKKPHFLELPR